MPTYKTTHPWLTFTLNLKEFPYSLWMLLGEARSKCDHIAGAPLRPEEAERLYHIYLSKGAHATTSIEGNTLSEEEVSKRIKDELPLGKSREYQGQAIDNIVDAVNGIARDVQAGRKPALSRERLCEFNRLVLKGQQVDDDTRPGEIRRHSVGVLNYRGAPHEECALLVDTLSDWLNGDHFRSDEPNLAFALLLAKAVVAHLYIAWIHPFGDGNGRTARLIEFELLVESGHVPFPAAHLLSNHFNLTRDRYYRELQKASASGGGFVPFFAYAMEGFVDGLRSQIDYIRSLQYRDVWVNFVHDRFRGNDTPSARRRKHLVLDMPSGKSFSLSEISRVSVRVGVAYDKTTERTLERDIKALLDVGLLSRQGKRYAINDALVSAFLPPRANPTSGLARPQV